MHNDCWNGSWAMSNWLEHARAESAGNAEESAVLERGTALRQGIDTRLRRRRLARGVATAGAAASLLAAALLIGLDKRSNERVVAIQAKEATPAIQAPSAPEATWSFADGSRATALAPSAQWKVDSDDQRGTVVRLEAGDARFDVEPRADRPFVVRAGTLEVQVIGTRFDVLRSEAGVIEVSVDHGEVRVVTPSEETRLRAGDRRRFDTRITQEPAAQPAAGLTKTRAEQHAQPARDVAGSLLATADRARREGRPGEAVVALQALVRGHASDPRAPSAAFSLGRVLLETQHEFREAAAAFAMVSKLDRHSPLAEDALARQVEAWARAGSTEKARGLAEQYLREYPGGARSTSVRAHARLP